MKTSVHFLASAALAAALSAVPETRGEAVPAEDAARAAQAWIGQGFSMGKLPAGRAIEGVDELADSSTGALLRIVRFAGGGFVVLSADDLVEPVLAFSETGTGVEPCEGNPFWALLRGDIAAREAAAGIVRGGTAQTRAPAPRRIAAASVAARKKWAALLADGADSPGAAPKAMQGVPSVSDVRVEPFVESKWGQSTSDNRYGSTNFCYNYYTPSNFVCGCTATAIAQLMRYWEFPSGPVEANTYPCRVSGRARDMTMQGGIYDWSSMPPVPRDIPNLAEPQRQAIGKLCHDVGVTVEMEWASGSSGASLYAGVACLPTDFGYANAKAVHFGGAYDPDLLRQALVPNLDARCPCGLSVSGAGGHSVLVDGYGYSGGDFFLHLNMGWSGTDDAWYRPPELGTTQYPFNAIDGFLFNVFPRDTGSIASGRVLDATGLPVAGATVTLSAGTAAVGTAVSDANGIYAFIVQPGEYLARAEKDGIAAETAVSVGTTTGTTIVTDPGKRGNYYPGTGRIGNTCGNDIPLTGIESVPAPVFSPESCLFHPSTNVTISCADPGAVVRYTTDGSTPGETSARYAAPIFVEDTVTIKARAFAPGKNPSAVVGMTYTYDAAAGAPKGDFFADPIKISGTRGTRAIEDNSGYGVEEGEPRHTLEGGSYFYQYRTVWYLWTAPGTGRMEFRTASSGGGYLYPTYIAAYTGDSISSLERLAFSVDRDSGYVTTLSIDVEQGTAYRIVGMMGCDGTGAFTLSWDGDLSTERTPYETWADANGLSDDPADATDGVPNAFRYVFGKPTGPLSPVSSVVHDGTAGAVLALPAIANPEGATLKILSTTNIADWSSAAAEERTLAVGPDGKAVLGDTGPMRFYRLGIVFSE